MEEKKIRTGKEIWPGETNEELNYYLGRLNIKAKFLLSDGIEFTYPPEDIEVHDTGSGIYFNDTKTKDLILYYYEDGTEEGMSEEEKAGIKSLENTGVSREEYNRLLDKFHKINLEFNF